MIPFREFVPVDESAFESIPELTIPSSRLSHQKLDLATLDWSKVKTLQRTTKLMAEKVSEGAPVKIQCGYNPMVCFDAPVGGGYIVRYPEEMRHFFVLTAEFEDEFEPDPAAGDNHYKSKPRPVLGIPIFANTTVKVSAMNPNVEPGSSDDEDILLGPGYLLKTSLEDPAISWVSMRAFHYEMTVVNPPAPAASGPAAAL